jgi:hypothetical protein
VKPFQRLSLPLSCEQAVETAVTTQRRTHRAKAPVLMEDASATLASSR